MPFVPIPIAAGSSSGSGSSADATIELPVVNLRRHKDEEDEEDKDDSEDIGRCQRHKHRHGEPEPIVARIVISGNSSELLDLVEAVPLHPKRGDGLKLHLANQDADADGFILTHIYVYDRATLSAVTSAFDGAVVLGDDVLALDAPRDKLALAVVGNGDLFVSSPTVNASLASLDVVVTGNGGVQLQVAQLQVAKTLDVDVAGGGGVVLTADDVTAETVAASVTGSGAVVVETRGLLTADALDVSVFGSGVASISTSGQVYKEKLELSGSGSLLAGSVLATVADVSVWGSGEVLVQVSRKLTVSTSVWGAVGYIGALPEKVKIEGWWFWRSADSIVYPALANDVVAAQLSPLPSPYPTYYVVETRYSAHSDDPNVIVVHDEALDLMSATVAMARSVEESTGLSTVAISAIGIAVLTVNVVAARSWAQHRVRRHYRRLL